MRPFGTSPLFRLLWMPAACLLVFLLIYSAERVPGVYWRSMEKWMGRCVKEDVNFTEDEKRFADWSEENLIRWDVQAYEEIRDYGYYGREGVSEFNFSFYPLFSYIWRISGLSARGVSLLNYLLFVTGLLLLWHAFPDKGRASWLFLAALAIPSSVVFLIPYSEASCLFFFALAAFLYARQRPYWGLLALGLFAMTRPVGIIVVLAMVCTELWLYFLYGEGKKRLRSALLTIPGLLIGTALVFLIQALQSGESLSFLDSQETFGTHLRWPTEWTDWSREGNALSFFGLFGLCLPLVLAVFPAQLRRRMRAGRKQESSGPGEYFFVLSAVYCIGITLFVLFMQGGNLHSYQRYLLASPFFFILLFMLPGRLKAPGAGSFRLALLYLSCILLGLILWLTFPVPTFRLQGAGFFLCTAFALLLLFGSGMPPRRQFAVAAVIALLSIAFQTYLMHNFLVGCWLFL